MDYVTDFARRGLKRKGLELARRHSAPAACFPAPRWIRFAKNWTRNCSNQPRHAANAGRGRGGGRDEARKTRMKYFKRGVLLITPGDREDIVLAACTGI